MAMINNWDLKDANTKILITDGRAYHIVSDLGASFGKLANNSTSRSGRSVNSPKDYAASSFIKEVRNGVIELDYRGRDEGVVKGIKREDGRWLADLLTQLTDGRIEDAFRAAKYGKKSIGSIHEISGNGSTHWMPLEGVSPTARHELLPGNLSNLTVPFPFPLENNLDITCFCDLPTGERCLSAAGEAIQSTLIYKGDNHEHNGY